MAATVVGTVLSSVAGANIARDMDEKVDEKDRACVGHTLELRNRMAMAILNLA